MPVEESGTCLSGGTLQSRPPADGWLGLLAVHDGLSAEANVRAGFAVNGVGSAEVLGNSEEEGIAVEVVISLAPGERVAPVVSNEEVRPRATDQSVVEDGAPTTLDGNERVRTQLGARRRLGGEVDGDGSDQSVWSG